MYELAAAMGGLLLLAWLLSSLVRSKLTPEQKHSLRQIRSWPPIGLREFVSLMGGEVDEEVAAEVLKEVAREADVKPECLRPHDRLVEDLAFCTVDALDLTSVILGQERKFGVRIGDEEATSVRTVGDLVRLFDEKRRSAEAG